MKVSFKLIALIAISSLVTVPVFSQNKSTAKKASPSGGASLSDEMSKKLCKPWVLDTVSEFGVDSKPKGKQIGDGITFVADGSFFMTENGEAFTGKWAYAGGRLNATTTNPDRKISFKIISLADTRMVLEYQTPDLRKIRYTYWPKK